MNPSFSFEVVDAPLLSNLGQAGACTSLVAALRALGPDQAVYISVRGGSGDTAAPCAGALRGGTRRPHPTGDGTGLGGSDWSLVAKGGDEMSRVRVVRVLVHEGEPDWVETSVEMGLVGPNRPFVAGAGTLTEFARSRVVLPDPEPTKETQ